MNQHRNLHVGNGLMQIWIIPWIVRYTLVEVDSILLSQHATTPDALIEMNKLVFCLRVNTSKQKCSNGRFSQMRRHISRFKLFFLQLSTQWPLPIGNLLSIIPVKDYITTPRRYLDHLPPLSFSN